MARKRLVALLRGINVGGHNKLPMADLRALAETLGWQRVRSYIQSGNLVFEAPGTEAALERKLEAALQEQTSLSIPVIVRAGDRYRRLVEENPFAEAGAREPNRVMLALSKAVPERDALVLLEERASAGERVALVGDGLWIHYANGAGNTKLSPALLDRAVGSTITARNLRTCLKLSEMLGEA